MHSSKLLLAAIAAPALAISENQKPGMNVYFGQTGSDTLASYCDAGGFDTVTLAYLTASPETDPATNYPGTNFGSHCSASVYMANNTASRLLSGCDKLSQDIVHCQKQGKKVLLSIGGIWGPDPAHDYEVTTSANGEYFADFLWNAFGPYQLSWTGPRPFDIANSATHTVLDGFDFDIEVLFEATAGYIALLKRLRVYVDAYNARVINSPIIITGAPQCPLTDGWTQMKDLIQSTVFDKLWIQFYGNDLCPAGSAGFNFDEWESFVANTPSKNALLYVGLPAIKDVMGYLSTEQAIVLVDVLKSRERFGGIMIRDAAIDKANTPNGGKPIYEAVYEHLLDQAPGPMTASTTAVAPNGAKTKTESVTVALTKTIFATGHSSLPPFAANSSSVLGTGSVGTVATVFVTGTCVPSDTVSSLGDGLPSGTQTRPLHTHTYSVTSAGVLTGMVKSVMVVAVMVSVIVSCLF